MGLLFRKTNAFVWLLAAAVAWCLPPMAACAQSSSEPALPATLQRIDFEIEQDKADDFDWKGLARAVTGLQPGMVLTEDRLKQAVAELVPFAEVDTIVDLDDQGAAVKFRLQPFKRIKSIAIDDNFPLFERDVRNVMTVAPGDFFHAGDMPRQADLIVARYKAEGYIDPAARILWDRDGQDGHYRLRVEIDKGPAYHLKDVKLVGNHAFGDALLKSKMRVWRRSALPFFAERFIEKKLVEDVRKLTEYYRRQGFVEAALDYRLNADADAGQVVVTIDIAEGPRYDVRFQGNQAFSDAALREDLALFESGNTGSIGLRRSARQIQSRYVQAGFPDAAVDWQRPPSSAPRQSPALSSAEGPEVQVVFNIDEGPRKFVERIEIIGNKHVPEERIREQLLLRPSLGIGDQPFVRETLEEDLAALRALYMEYGYLNTQVSTRIENTGQPGRVAIILEIDEGPRTLVGRVALEGNIPIPPADLKDAATLDTGEPFRPYLVESDENALAAKISAQGYPYVDVQGDVALNPDQSRADVVYRIDAGPRVKVGQLFFSGDFRTRTNVLTRQIPFNQGDPFELAEVLQAQRNLRALDIFESVQVRTIGLKERASTVHLLVETIEKEPYAYELGGGYQTDKGVYLRSRLSDLNFRGANQSIWVGGEASEVGYRAEAGYSDPRVFNSPVRTDFGIFTERSELFNQVFGTDTYGGSLGFSLRLGRFVTTDLGLRYERREQFLRQDEAAEDLDPEALERRSILVTTPAIRFDSRDSFITPTRGMLAGLSVDISRGLDGSLDNFVKYTVDLRTYHTMTQRLVLALRFQGGYLDPFGSSEDVPLDQLFFLGGTASVRGFEENLLRFDENHDPVGGRLYFSGNLEGRLDLGRNFELAAFLDGGSVRQVKADAGGDDDIRWSTGLGLRYITPIGPIGLLYGFKINPQPRESNGQVHFTFGYTF